MKVRFVMKFKRPELGKSRVRRRFLLFPKRIGGETRWLELATWKEEVAYRVDRQSRVYEGWTWKPVCWIDRKGPFRA